MILNRRPRAAAGAKPSKWVFWALGGTVATLASSACGGDGGTDAARGGSSGTSGAGASATSHGGHAGTTPASRGGTDASAGMPSGGSMVGGIGGAAGGTGARPSSQGGHGPMGGAGGDAAGAASAGAGGDGGAADAPDRSDELFDPERLPRFDLVVPQESWNALSEIVGPADEQQDEYVTADLRYGDQIVQNVGLRIKGEGSFRRLDDKAPFKIKFDEFVPNQTFYGLKRLAFNNMVEDPSFLAERLAYEFFREAGLPAPRCNNALVYVNGTFFGVYANVEAEDKRFLARWFASDEGNLFEEGQKDFLPGAETSFELETNEEANDRTRLVALIDAVQSARSESFLADLESVLDTSHFLRFTAAEAAVNQWDMYAYTVFYPNNFRIYENPADARFVFLPWGMDMSMKPYRDSGRPHIPVFGIAREYDGSSSRITAGIIFRKCLESSTCKASYTERVREIADLYERAGLATRAARYYAQIKDAVYADPRKEYTNQRFEEAYQILRKTIQERPGALRADLD